MTLCQFQCFYVYRLWKLGLTSHELLGSVNILFTILHRDIQFRVKWRRTSPQSYRPGTYLLYHLMRLAQSSAVCLCTTLQFSHKDEGKRWDLYIVYIIIHSFSPYQSSQNIFIIRKITSRFFRINLHHYTLCEVDRFNKRYLPSSFPSWHFP